MCGVEAQGRQQVCVDEVGSTAEMFALSSEQAETEAIKTQG